MKTFTVYLSSPAWPHDFMVRSFYNRRRASELVRTLNSAILCQRHGRPAPGVPLAFVHDDEPEERTSSKRRIACGPGNGELDAVT